ncbi:MAG: hypothetical protein E7309_15595 [Butyrivibrio sp.]|jgi:hypothetical protein|nr:hypothetical protein [Butyrivibrio sp.]
MKSVLKKIMILSAFFASLSLLSGCGSSTGSVPGKIAVYSYVKELTKEKVELIGTEQVCDDPLEIQYTFSSKERDLVFHVSSYRKPNYVIWGAPPFGYVKAIKDDYQDCIDEYYRTAIEQLFEDFTSDYYGYLLEDADDVAHFAQAIAAANAIYSEEYSYNSKEYIDEHPYGSLHAQVIGIEGNLGIDYYDIDGSEITADELEDDILTKIAQDVKDGKVASDIYSGTSEYVENMHISKLDHIYLDDEEMLYDNNNSEYVYYGLITDEYCYSTYNYDVDSYMMVCDAGMVAEYWGSPALVIPEYVSRLGGTYELISTDQEARDLDLECKWTIDSHTWHMTAHYDEKNEEYSDRLSDIKVTKDGKEVPLTIYPSPDNRPLFTLTVDDFCKLFDLTYTIDEEGRSVYFFEQ